MYYFTLNLMASTCVSMLVSMEMKHALYEGHVRPMLRLVLVVLFALLVSRMYKILNF